MHPLRIRFVKVIIVSIALFHFVNCSAEMRWPENADAITIKLKVRQSSSADWFGIGFSTGYLMVQKLYQCHSGLYNISKFQYHA